MLGEHGDRRMARLEADGRKTTLADRYQGKRLNSPNDLVFKSNGDLYFTDPPFGLPKAFDDPRKELAFSGVYRLSSSGELTLLTRDIKAPNGIAFSPSEKTLYVSNADPNHAVWLAYDVRDDGTLANGRVFSEPGGTPDGFRLDVDGNLWCGWGMGNEKQDGVKIFDPTGKPIGFIALPERCANVCFGGVKRNRLFMAASHAVYSLYVNTQGVKGG